MLTTYLFVKAPYIRSGAREARALGNLADQLALLKPWPADYACHTTASPPGLKMLSTPLRVSLSNMSFFISFVSLGTFDSIFVAMHSFFIYQTSSIEYLKED